MATKAIICSQEFHADSTTLYNTVKGAFVGTEGRLNLVFEVEVILTRLSSVTAINTQVDLAIQEEATAQGISILSSIERL